MRVDTLPRSNEQSQGPRRREWLSQHSPQHLQQCAVLTTQALQLRAPAASRSTLVLGAGACTEVSLTALTRVSQEVVLADVDLAAMQRGRDELTSSALCKRIRFVQCDITGGVSSNLASLIRQQNWQKLVSQGSLDLFDALALCLEQCDTPPGAEGPRHLLPLLCRRDAEKWSVAPTRCPRNGGGKAERAHPFMRILPWVVPCLLVLPCLTIWDEWPTTLVFGVLGRPNTRIFRC